MEGCFGKKKRHLAVIRVDERMIKIMINYTIEQCLRFRRKRHIPTYVPTYSELERSTPTLLPTTRYVHTYVRTMSLLEANSAGNRYTRGINTYISTKYVQSPSKSQAQLDRHHSLLIHDTGNFLQRPVLLR